MLRNYLRNISRTDSLGDAREESYYQHLSNLLQIYSNDAGKKDIQITILPKKTEAGNPDFRIWDGRQHITGYIEAKKPGENLDNIESSEQLDRYLSTFPNLILTDFYEFRLYRNGRRIDKIQIGRYFISKKLGKTPPPENQDRFKTFLDKFFSFISPKIYSAENFANELAKRTGFLRDEIVAKELEEEESGKGMIIGFYETFKKYLVSNLTPEEFADIYSQTITYGLFAARTRANKDFNRKLAYDYIPKTIGILKDVFSFISLGKLSPQMEVIVDDISEVLQTADVNNILDEFYRKGKGEDPVVHFYETFLNVYDPATREKRGVYYTPEPVVKYIVRAVHELLKNNFDLHDGLANKEVTLLDPAGGTLTFPAEAIKLAVKEFTDKYGDGGKYKFIKNRILKNFYAFELMMAPYAIGHIKISFLLEELGYVMQDDDRFNLYLTNTLDMADLQQTEIPGLESLSHESHLAAKVKKSEPILVIMGNPPYSGISANINEWTEKLLKENLDGASTYYEVDGESLGERKLWLQDDYVKFLRFAQWKIHKAGQGIVGMITNHGYLDNPTFRGMRQSLMNTFNEIYIIDLHGNSLKKETCPDGSKDENVFDIMQGVSIVLMSKKRNAKGCKVYHRDLFGLREEKYGWLEKRDFKKRDYEVLKPKSPWYFFIERNTEEIEYYNEWIKIDDIFNINVAGIITSRDDLLLSFSNETLEIRINQLRNNNFSDDFFRDSYNVKDNSEWKLSEARKKLSNDSNWNKHFTEVLYRPFDNRFIYYNPIFVHRDRFDVMQHMLNENLGLCISKRVEINRVFEHAFITSGLVTHHSVSLKEVNYLFPLYLYPTEKTKKKSLNLMLFEAKEEYKDEKRKANISDELIQRLTKSYKTLPAPEQILAYVYGILYSNVYREKFAEFLKIDFPRIPFTKNYQLFLQISEIGEELIELHLMKHKFDSKVKYTGRGKDDTIGKPVYSEEEKTVHINEYRYFENIAPEVWNYHIGGYQVMEKYLKDRKGRQMDDPGHYCRMAASISKTIEIQQRMDKLFPKVEKSTI